MLYDTKKQDYCKYYNGKGNGNYRSPEEFMDHELNEKIDVWSLGNNFYSLLTNGLWIFYNINTKNVDIQVNTYHAILKGYALINSFSHFFFHCIRCKKRI